MPVHGSELQLTRRKSLLHAALRPAFITLAMVIAMVCGGMGLNAAAISAHAKDVGRDGAGAVTNTDVYVAGTFGLAKNGVLLNQYVGEIYSVYVTESNDVYAAGKYGNDAVYYKNGKRFILPKNTLSDYACATSIHVSGSDVYVSAYEFRDFEHGSYARYDARVWRNSIEQNLSMPEDSYDGSQANSVYVSGGNMYVAGCIFNDGQLGKGTLWRNRIVQNWRGPSNFASVFVSGRNVYASGEGGLWKDNVKQNLQRISPSEDGLLTNSVRHTIQNTNPKEGNWSAGIGVYSVYVSDSKVYAAGFDWDSTLKARVAVLWTDGVATRLGSSSNPSYASSVHAYGNDLYVAGYEVNSQRVQVAMLWKVTGGSVQTMRLSDGIGNQRACSVVVVPAEDVGQAAADAFMVNPSVYVAGDFENFGLMRDGAIQNQYAGELYSVHVTGANEVYAAGYFGNEAVCYKNGTRYMFPRNSSSDLAEAKSVYVSDSGNVHVAGRECYDSDGHSIAKLWLNGVEQALALGPNVVSSSAYSVHVSGNDVYVAGYEHNGQKQRGVLWKNNVDQNWDFDNAFNSVFVSGGSVYVGGEHGLWKDKVKQNLQGINTGDGDGNTHVNSICVSGDRVYAAGQVIDRSMKGWVAVLWTDGAVTRLGGIGNSSYANSVHVYGSDVYVAGYEVNAEGFKAAKLWRVSNGSAPQTISLSEVTSSQCAWSVYVR